MAKNIQISLRLSPDSHRQLSDYSEINNLSLNSAVIQAIQMLLRTDSLERRIEQLEDIVAELRK